jgi:hypothetical protein
VLFARGRFLVWANGRNIVVNSIGAGDEPIDRPPLSCRQKQSSCTKREIDRVIIKYKLFAYEIGRFKQADERSETIWDILARPGRRCYKTLN